MPNFFEDREENLATENRFFLSGGQSFHPRPQIFSPYKPFKQDARWGWQKQKFRTETEIVFPARIKPNSMPDIETETETDTEPEPEPQKTNSMPDIET